MAGWRSALVLVAAMLPVPSTAVPVATAVRVDLLAHALMVQTGAKGVAVAVIDHGHPVVVRGYGVRDAAGAPLDTGTVMYGASLTKAVFAYAVMLLVEDAKFDLDTPVATYLPRPLPDYGNVEAYGHWGNLAGDERWRVITARHVLTHSTGFANYAFLEPDATLRIHFDPGSRFAYSGEGIMLLQFVIEQGIGVDLGRFIQSRIFNRLGMANTGLMWRAAFAADLADGWTIDGKPEPHDRRGRVRLAGSMDTTIAEFASFAAMLAAEASSRGAAAAMIVPTLAITTASQFPTLQPEAPASARIPGLAAGLGVVTFRGPQGPGFYKGGHNDSTGNIMVCLERDARCVVVLSNDVRAERGFPLLVDTLLGPTGMPWRWEYPEQFTPAAP